MTLRDVPFIRSSGERPPGPSLSSALEIEEALVEVAGLLKAEDLRVDRPNSHRAWRTTFERDPYRSVDHLDEHERRPAAAENGTVLGFAREDRAVGGHDGEPNRRRGRDRLTAHSRDEHLDARALSERHLLIRHDIETHPGERERLAPVDRAIVVRIRIARIRSDLADLLPLAEPIVIRVGVAEIRPALDLFTIVQAIAVFVRLGVERITRIETELLFEDVRNSIVVVVIHEVDHRDEELDRQVLERRSAEPGDELRPARDVDGW